MFALFAVIVAVSALPAPQQPAEAPKPVAPVESDLEAGSEDKDLKGSSSYGYGYYGYPYLGYPAYSSLGYYGAYSTIP